jgi:uncharacterized protein YndB with AHSA1/START domain
MFWILIAVAALIALILTVMLIGSLLPEDHVASRTLTLQETPHSIWQVITDFASQPKWHPEVKRVERLPDFDGHEVWLEEYQRSMRIPLETIESDANRRLVRRIADHNLPFGGVWEYNLTPTTDGGCQLTITERGRVRNPFFRFMSRFVFGHTATIEKYLSSLAKRFGETAAIK